MSVKFTFVPEQVTDDELLITNFEVNGPDPLLLGLLDGLLTYAATDGYESLVAHSSQPRVESLLEETGFEIVEKYDDTGIVAGAIKLKSERTTE